MTTPDVLSDSPAEKFRRECLRRHSLHAIAGQLSPAHGCTGIEVPYSLHQVEGSN